MYHTSLVFLITTAFAAGFVDAIVGGGGLISLPSLLAMGLPPKIALGSNKMIGISTAIAGSAKYVHAKTVKWSGLRIAVPLSFCGAVLGAWLTTFLTPELLRHVIFYSLISIALFLMFNKKIGLLERQAILPITFVWPMAFVLGIYDGFFGPGVGTFLVVGFVHFFGYSFLPASATGRILNLASNIGAILLFYHFKMIDFTFIIPAMGAAFVGGLLGATYAVKFGPKGIRPILFLVVFGLITKLGIALFL